MRLSYEYTTHVEFAPHIGRHNILLRCLPSDVGHIEIESEQMTLSEGFDFREGLDGFCNRIITAENPDWHDHLSYCVNGIIKSNTYCITDTHPHSMYSLPSRLTIPSRDMQILLPRMTGNFIDDCLNITHAVNRHIVYSPGLTTILTTASEVYLHRKGVCQDYTHLMIALCRKAGFCARYVCGLMMGEGQTHAWVEVHDGKSWYAFDPTNDSAVAFGYIKIAHGRDALDCPVCRGIYTGVAQQKTNINVIVKEI